MRSQRKHIENTPAAEKAPSASSRVPNVVIYQSMLDKSPDLPVQSSTGARLSPEGGGSASEVAAAAEEENGKGKAKDSPATTWSVFAPFSFSMDAVASHPLLSAPVAFS